MHRTRVRVLGLLLGLTSLAGCDCGGTPPVEEEACKAGETRDCYDGAEGTSGVGACKAGVQTCQEDVFGACEGQVLPVAETCNGVDDDCDGTVDEGCDCVDGATQSCYSGDPATRGVGACTDGVQTCVAGQWGACAGGTLPSAETCNGVDEDCDGAVDEGNPGGGVACESGLLGACGPGATQCEGGVLKCVQDVQPATELCDGIDNDCDGIVDQGDPGAGQVCDTGLLGVCKDGSTSCSEGATLCTANLQPSEEICDGLDNDCDGEIDEGNPGGDAACNTGLLGVCSAGLSACIDGNLQCVQQIQPSSETCDGIDNDCNGTPDDGNPGAGLACNTGLLGVCAGGTTACFNGGIVCNQNLQPALETCDGLDNDCNGAPDDGNPGGGASCSTGQLGVCAGGTTACSNGGIVCNQLTQPSAEICDDLDNDCNGTPDDGNPGGGLACSTGLPGVCSGGTTACSNGAIRCNQNVQASAELCDGKDNDCDGVLDNGNPGGGLACSTGQVGVCAPGTTVCSNGAITCGQNVQSGPELCDTQDNDCDGAIDEGNPGGGGACTTGLPGICAAGTVACSGGALTCQQNAQATPEVCDGLDNDCDGAIDEGNPGGGVSCLTGQPGRCAVGVVQCSNGALTCQAVNGPIAEVCGNSEDDDCDGQIDENEDLDGDGFGVCDGDCCDAVGGCGTANPAHVNPGALELLNNGVDDDCNPSTSDTTPAPLCSNTTSFSATTAQKLTQGMDLCQFTTANPPQSQKKWGVISASLTSADLASGTPVDVQVGVLNNYGPNVQPQRGVTMSAISTGTARDNSDPGFISPNGNAWQLGTSGNPPQAYLAAHGGQLPVNAGCGQTTGAYDSVNLRLQIRVPTNASKLRFKYKFYTADYPEWVCTEYNDYFLVLLTSQGPGLPADKNIVFDSLNRPVTVNSDLMTVCSGCSSGTAELVGTGMGGASGSVIDGAGTNWLTATASVLPGETITLEFIIFDTSDHSWDSLALIDAFEFLP